MVKKKGLGKGLDSLIPGSKNTIEEQKSEKKEEDNSIAKLVDINKVEPNREQPRKFFEEDSLLELAESIKRNGLLQPLVVQDRKSYYEIIAGERRWRASKKAGLKKIPVIIKDYSDQEIVEISLIENIQRENLNSIEEAMAYKRLLEEFHLKQDDVAERVCKSRTAVTNAMRLLKLDERVQQMIIDEMISTGHARALLAIDDNDIQYDMANRVYDEKLSVREVEKMVKDIKNPKKPKEKKSAQKDIAYEEMANRMKEIMGTKIKIVSKSGGRGKIEIEYTSDEELERMFDIIVGIGKEE